MVQWSDIVRGSTVGTFVTINSERFGYRNDIRPNTGPAINVIGNPTRFFSANGFEANIADGRTRNCMWMFIYNALRAESDYTDAQAAAWTGEVLFQKVDVAQGSLGGLVEPWAVPAGYGGSRTNLNATQQVNQRRLTLVAIQDRNGHARVWAFNDQATNAQQRDNTFNEYVKLTDARINTLFGLQAGPPAAVAGSFAPGNVSAELTTGREGRIPFDAATGGTGDVSYTIALNGGITDLGVSGNNLIIPADTIAGTYRVAVRATWTSGSTTADAVGFFNIQFTRVEASRGGGHIPPSMLMWLLYDLNKRDKKRKKK